MADFPEDLADQYRKFREDDFSANRAHYQQLAQTQTPQTMIIACADSRVPPEIIFNAQPGDLFTVRNVANLVPPYETGGTYHGVSAALEFAVVNLAVKNIIIMGHSGCGGIKACLHHRRQNDEPSFVTNWMSLLVQTRDKLAAANIQCPTAHLLPMLERAGIKTSLKNLRTFPEVQKREHNGSLKLYGAHFDIAHGLLTVLDEKSGEFSSIPLNEFAPIKAREA